VLDVKYDIEKRVNSLLPRDLDQPNRLVFRAYSKSYTDNGGSTVELRLEACSDAHNLYALQFEASAPGDPAKEKVWEANVQRNFDHWTQGLALTDVRMPSSPERYRHVLEFELADPLKPDDAEAIQAVQAEILRDLQEGKSFFTANKEGGTHIRLLNAKFVLQDYGESNDREEFSSSADFLVRLRKFYDWESRRDWRPHAPPEIEAWKFIARQLKK
jgi:hypothetical protein